MSRVAGERKARHVAPYSDGHIAQSYLPLTSQTSGAAEADGVKNTAKYAFLPIAVESTGAIHSDELEFLGELGKRVAQLSDHNRAAHSCSNA